MERFLQNNYNAEQLSTYALTLYRHQSTSPDGLVFNVGAYAAAQAWAGRVLYLQPEAAQLLATRRRVGLTHSAAMQTSGTRLGRLALTACTLPITSWRTAASW